MEGDPQLKLLLYFSSGDYTVETEVWHLVNYRVSHPIVREISSCFVLGVPLPCLGSSLLQYRPTSRELPKTKPKHLYEWWDGKLCITCYSHSNVSFFPRSVCYVWCQRIHRRLRRLPGPPPGPEHHCYVWYVSFIHGLGNKISTPSLNVYVRGTWQPWHEK